MNPAWLLLLLMLGTTQIDGRTHLPTHDVGVEISEKMKVEIPKYKLPEDWPFIPFLLTEYAKWAPNHSKHFSLFPKVLTSSGAMTYAFKRSDVPKCSSVGERWVEQTPVLSDLHNRPSEAVWQNFLNQTIFCSWTPFIEEGTNVVMWFKDHTHPGEFPMIDGCPPGWNLIGKANAAYYVKQSGDR